MPLSYGRATAPWRPKWRHAVVAAVLLGCACGSWFGGRQARSHAQTLLYQRQAAAYQLSADTVVYDDHPLRAAELLGAGTHVRLPHVSGDPVAILESPAALAALGAGGSLSGLDPVGALVFLHELTTPSGLRRIVAVRFLPAYLDGRILPGGGLVAHVIEPATLISPPRVLGESQAPLLVDAAPPLSVKLNGWERGCGSEDGLDAWRLGPPVAGLGPWDGQGASAVGDRWGGRWCLSPTEASPALGITFDPHGRSASDLRWYAGQRSARDPSHFTVDYQLDGRRSTVDGYLTDDGRHVRMTVRSTLVAGAGMSNVAHTLR